MRKLCNKHIFQMRQITKPKELPHFPETWRIRYRNNFCRSLEKNPLPCNCSSLWIKILKNHTSILDVSGSHLKCVKSLGSKHEYHLSKVTIPKCGMYTQHILMVSLYEFNTRGSGGRASSFFKSVICLFHIQFHQKMSSICLTEWNQSKLLDI